MVEGGDKARVSVAAGRSVSCGSVIVATNSPFNDWVVIHTSQAAYRTYVLAARIPRGSVARGLYWDEPGSSHEAYHSIRVRKASRDSDPLIIGGEDHKTGQADDADKRYARLEQWGRERFRMMRSVDFRLPEDSRSPLEFREREFQCPRSIRRLVQAGTSLVSGADPAPFRSGASGRA
jgi:hypothetical protein